MKKTLWITGTLIVIAVAVYFLFFFEYYPNNTFQMAVDIEIPGSTYHTNATWWGYNQSKLVRLEDQVFTYYIDNSTQVDDVANIDNPNQAVLVTIDDTGHFEEFDRIDTSRPVNVVIDEARKLVYYLAIEPTIHDNGSTGKLVMYKYSVSDTSVTFIEKTVVVDHNESMPLETVNIRFSATIDASGNIAVAYGLADPNYVFSMVVQIFYVEENRWEELSISTGEFGIPNFYPDIAMKSPNDFLVLAIQDQCLSDACYYQFLRYFKYESGTWTVDYLEDYRNTTYASEPILLEHTEVYLDQEGTYYMVYRSMLEHDVITLATFNPSGVIEKRVLDTDKDINWVRIVELQGEKYFVMHGNSRTQIADFETLKVLQNDFVDFDGGYVYAYSDSVTGIDVYILSGNSKDFPNYGVYHCYRLIE